MPKPKINRSTALPKVVAYLKENQDIFYCCKDLANLVKFELSDGVTPLGLTHSLPQAMGYEHEVVKEVSYLRLWKTIGGTGGTYFGIETSSKPKEYGAFPSDKGKTTFEIYGKGKVRVSLLSKPRKRG